MKAPYMYPCETEEVLEKLDFVPKKSIDNCMDEVDDMVEVKMELEKVLELQRYAEKEKEYLRQIEDQDFGKLRARNTIGGGSTMELLPENPEHCEVSAVESLNRKLREGKTWNEAMTESIKNVEGQLSRLAPEIERLGKQLWVKTDAARDAIADNVRKIQPV